MRMLGSEEEDRLLATVGFVKCFEGPRMLKRNGSDCVIGFHSPERNIPMPCYIPQGNWLNLTKL